MVAVSDGDTITVLDSETKQHKVRVNGIDAPEKGQAFGERSTQNLSALVFQKRVEARCHKKDRYGREVCTVYVASRDVGLEQIRTGLAWHYKAYQHEQPTQERLIYRDGGSEPRGPGNYWICTCRFTRFTDAQRCVAYAVLNIALLPPRNKWRGR